jgi:hypothetical protein
VVGVAMSLLSPVPTRRLVVSRLGLGIPWCQLRRRCQATEAAGFSLRGPCGVIFGCGPGSPVTWLVVACLPAPSSRFPTQCSCVPPPTISF